MTTRLDIERAASTIAPYVRETPVLLLDELTLNVSAKIYLKLESLQVTGSFKPRGVFNNLLGQKLTDAGVVAASGGNHGLAVAYAAWQTGVKAEIFLPTLAPQIKRQALMSLGAKVIIEGDVYVDALAASVRRSEETGAFNIHAFNHAETVAGQGTIAREFENQASGLDTVLVAVGGGGLIAGVAAWFNGKANVVAVEPEGCPTLNSALLAGSLVDVSTSGIAADSLGCRRVGDVPFAILNRLIHNSLLVSEDNILQAQRFLWEHFRIVAEPGGTVAFAALLCGAYMPAKGERVGIIICGGNADPRSFTET